MDFQALAERFRQEYGAEYARFLLADFAPPPRLCPNCQTETLRKLWLGDTASKRGDSVWGKWYMWCESCLQGIYCPVGTYTVPKGEPFIRWGDDGALKEALPAGLRLITPISSKE
jgi:hypothetical protein